MIELVNISKTWRMRGTARIIADDISIVFPTGSRVALIGRNGSGKSSLLNIISGAVDPDRGKVVRYGSVSWPIGYSGSFNKNLTGIENIRFIARVYGADSDELLDFAQDFSEIGKSIRLPLKTYSSGMRSRLSFAVSIGIKFNTYLIDEVTAVGDARFKEKCRSVLSERLKDSGLIMVSHSKKQIKENCTSAIVLENGKIEQFDDVREALRQHEENSLKPAKDSVSVLF